VRQVLVLRCSYVVFKAEKEAKAAAEEAGKEAKKA